MGVPRGFAQIRRLVDRLLDDAVRRRYGAAARRIYDRPPWSPWELPPLANVHGFPDEAFIVVPARHHVVYRLLNKPTARRRDFESNHAKERPRAPDEPYVDHLGLSVFGSEELAVANALRSPKHVAVLMLPPEAGFTIARTYADMEGHYSIWGDPDALLAAVDRVATQEDPA